MKVDARNQSNSSCEARDRRWQQVLTFSCLPESPRTASREAEHRVPGWLSTSFPDCGQGNPEGKRHTGVTDLLYHVYGTFTASLETGPPVIRHCTPISP